MLMQSNTISNGISKIGDVLQTLLTKFFTEFLDKVLSLDGNSIFMQVANKILLNKQGKLALFYFSLFGGVFLIVRLLKNENEQKQGNRRS